MKCLQLVWSAFVLFRKVVVIDWFVVFLILRLLLLQQYKNVFLDYQYFL